MPVIVCKYLAALFVECPRKYTDPLAARGLPLYYFLNQYDGGSYDINGCGSNDTRFDDKWPLDCRRDTHVS